jgi:hypothetical protein
MPKKPFTFSKKMDHNYEKTRGCTKHGIIMHNE